MSCPPKSKLSRYEHGAIDEGEGTAIDRHVAQCTTCQGELEKIRAVDQERKYFKAALGTVPMVADKQASSRAGSGVAMSLESGVRRAEFVKAGPADSQAGADDSTWAIADYERVALCGEGSYGSVWAVRDRVGVYRALKLIDLDRLERAGVTCYELSALENYCRKVSRHPYLVTVYHVGVVGRWLYYTMELADDQEHPGAIGDPFPAGYRPLTLATIIKNGRLKLDVVVEVARRLLRGLAKLHELDLLHRDVKPSNIIFVNRHPKLADIGILTVEQGPAKVVGTPKYMPPDRSIDKTADVYAMGVVLREMIESIPAVRADDVAEATRWDTARIDQVIQRACAERSAERYQSAAAMLEELENCRFEGTLFEALTVEEAPTIARPTVAIQLAFAFIHRIPWIMGGIIVIYILSKLLG